VFVCVCLVYVRVCVCLLAAERVGRITYEILATHHPRAPLNLEQRPAGRCQDASGVRARGQVAKAKQAIMMQSNYAFCREMWAHMEHHELYNIEDY
jgi:hypothetical protein